MSLDQAIARLNHKPPQLEPGHVWLAGAGPGDPGCLTLDVLSALGPGRRARAMTRWCRPMIIAVAEQAEKFYAGKRGGKLSIPQDEITAILVRLAARKAARSCG